SRGVLFISLALLIVGHDLFRTGAEPRRRARKWCARLQARERWPADLMEIRFLPEVLGLRDAAAIEPGPVFDLFRDPRPEVRAAAVGAALAEGGRRWGVVRDAVRGMLCDPRTRDAALPGAAGGLPVVAICDLTTWAAEPEPLGSRSVRTLLDHYSCVLQTT